MALRIEKKAFLYMVFSSALFIVCLMSVYTNWYNLQNSRETGGKQSSNTKYVLYWTTMFRDKNFYFKENGSDLFKGCEYQNCFATYNKSLLPVEQFDALLFYIPGAPNRKVIVPSKRHPHQRYIFAASETPVRFSGRRTQYTFNNFYNWTMTYRFDSDIVRRHGEVKISNNSSRQEMPTKEFVQNKTKSIAWFVSNCNSASKREHLVQKIQKYINVDIFGACGNLTCVNKSDCYNMLERDYRFYLSFENSHCKDYTTEKLYKILQKNVVPIVYGGGDYNTVTPPNSVINVEDFKTVKDLVNYIKHLEKNIDKYMEYFEWKKNYYVSTAARPSMCKLCEMLHDPNLSSKTYDDVIDWWFSKESSECKVDTELPHIVL